MSPEHALLDALGSAIAFLESTRTKQLRATTSQTVARNYDDLLDTLRQTKLAIENGTTVDTVPLERLVRWTADWIPILDNQLLRHMEAVELAVKVMSAE